MYPGRTVARPTRRFPALQADLVLVCARNQAAEGQRRSTDQRGTRRPIEKPISPPAIETSAGMKGGFHGVFGGASAHAKPNCEARMSSGRAMSLSTALPPTMGKWRTEQPPMTVK